MRIVTVSQMRDLERQTDAAGHSYAEMMEQAGRSVAEAVQAHWTLEGLSVLVLVGPGNNGGDGLVCARYLKNAGARVQVYIWKRETGQDENFRLARELEIPFFQNAQDTNLARATRARFPGGGDRGCPPGDGISRPLDARVKPILEAIQQSTQERQAPPPGLCSPILPPPSVPRLGPWIVAVDLPSCVNAIQGKLTRRRCRPRSPLPLAIPRSGSFAFPPHAM